MIMVLINRLISQHCCEDVIANDYIDSLGLPKAFKNQEVLIKLNTVFA